MIYVLSDLHGCYQQWKKMLSLISLRESDELYILGDILDRGEEPIKLLLDIMSRDNIFSLLGNHEYMFLQCVRSLPLEADIDSFMLYYEEQDFLNLAAWMQDGGRITFEQYLALTPDDKEAILDYLLELPIYDKLVLGEKNYLFTHSGLRNFSTTLSLEDYSAQDFLFDRPDIQNTYFEDRMLIFGHTPTFYYQGQPQGEIFKAKTFINLDCGCVFPEKGGRLGCLCLDDNRCFYI
ncbi:MAG: metallophosphoesterase [Acetivibrio sp.]